jgi:glutamine amidotransferase
VEAIRDGVEAGVPLLGICLGMQWLFDGSEEAPERPGLRLLEGRCYRLPAESNGTYVKIPHVGWNALDLRRGDSIVEGVPPGAQVYFTHSFAAPITTTRSRSPVRAAVRRDRAARPRGGVQFIGEVWGDRAEDPAQFPPAAR